MNENTVGYVSMVPSRHPFTRKLFPINYCLLPDAPKEYKDVLVTITRIELSFLDRLRILWNGKVEVQTKTVTENLIGGCITSNSVTCGTFSR